MSVTVVNEEQDKSVGSLTLTANICQELICDPDFEAANVQPDNVSLMLRAAAWQRQRIIQLLKNLKDDLEIQESQFVSKPVLYALMASIRSELAGKKEILEELVRQLS